MLDVSWPDEAVATLRLPNSLPYTSRYTHGSLPLQTRLRLSRVGVYSDHCNMPLSQGYRNLCNEMYAVRIYSQLIQTSGKGSF